MGLEESIILSIIDKLLIGVLMLVFGYWFNEKLEKLKGQINLTNAVAPNRANAYENLWEITEPFSPHFDKPHDNQEMEEVREKLSSWYYDDGNAMYLTFEASNLFLKSLALLDKEEDVPWEDIWKDIKKAFSSLRTQLKIDIGTYSQKEARRQLPESS